VCNDDGYDVMTMVMEMVVMVMMMTS